MAQRTTNRGRRAIAEDSALEGWLNSQVSPNTRAAYRLDLEAFGAWCERHGVVPLAADTAELIAFQQSREDAGDSNSTLRRRWSALSSFYKFAIERGLRTINPTAGVDRPKVAAGDPSPTMRLSVGAVEGYRAVAAALDPRLEALVALVVRDGLKLAEALALDIVDISGRSPEMTVTVLRRGAPTRIALEANSARAVRRCVGKRRHGPVFVNQRSSKSESPHRLTRFGADHLIRQLRTEGSGDQVTANALRRFHINARQAEGDLLDDVRESAGLADVRGVRRYESAATESPNLKTARREAP